MHPPLELLQALSLSHLDPADYQRLSSIHLPHDTMNHHSRLLDIPFCKCLMRPAYRICAIKSPGKGGM